MSFRHLHLRVSQSQTLQDKHLVAEEAAGDVDLLAPHNDNFLAVEDLLRDYRSEPSEEVALAINYDGGRRECGHGESVSKCKNRLNNALGTRLGGIPGGNRGER